MIFSSKEEKFNSFSYYTSSHHLSLFVSESKQVYELNPWLTYGEPMHRLRELGLHLPQLDRLDEVSFTAIDIHGLACFL